jgi:predicted glycosyltransferase
VLDFMPEPGILMRRADYVIGMGGYNTVCEILSFNKPALIVPRVEPRQEQVVRAERLRDMGLIDMLHPNRVTPAALSEWLDVQPQRQAAGHVSVDLDGLTRLPALLAEVLAPPLPSARTAKHRKGIAHVAR